MVHIGGEACHQLPAAHGELILVEGVQPPASFPADFNQPGIFQFFEVVADRGLVDPPLEAFHDLTHAEPLAAQHIHDFLPGAIRQGLGELQFKILHGINHIDIYRYVKG